MSISNHIDVLAVETLPAMPTEPIFRLSIEQYHAMTCEGILTEDDKVELLEGWLVPRMTKTPCHSLATLMARRALEAAIPTGWYVNSQQPVTCAESEPEPDAVVVRGEPRQYHDRHASPADVALIVEVADSSLSRDRGIKQRLYARAGIAVYWIINVSDYQLEVYTEPTGPTAQPVYRQRRDLGPADEVTLVFDGHEVARLAVRQLLP